MAANRIVITPPGRLSIPRVGDMWEAREVLYRFGARDVTLRYRQTLLGVVWVILQPLLTALVFVLVFGRIAHLPSGGVPYILLVFSGLLVFNLFQGIVTRAQSSLVANRDLVSKVFFPRMLVPLAVIYSNLVDFAVATVFLAILQIGFGVAPSWAVVLVPLWTLMAICLASGVGLLTAALTVRYRDVSYVVPFFLQFLTYASPVGYAVNAIPARYHLFFDVNPLTWLLNEFRWSFLDMAVPPGWQIILSIVVPVVVLLGGAMVFEQMERSVADLI